MFFALVFLAVGIAWSDHLAVLKYLYKITLLYLQTMCISVSWLVATELISPGGIGTDTGCAGR